MQNLIQISYKVQEIYGSLLTVHNRLDNCSTNPYLINMGGFACQWLGYDDMHICMQNVIKIYHKFGSRVMNVFTNWLQHGNTDGFT